MASTQKSNHDKFSVWWISLPPFLQSRRVTIYGRLIGNSAQTFSPAVY